MNEPIPLRLAKKGDRISFVRFLDSECEKFQILDGEYIVTDEVCHIEEEGVCQLVINKNKENDEGIWCYREKAVIKKD